MKKLYILFIIIGMVSVGCHEGPPGPPGYDGLDGLNGEESYVFEYELSFTAPDYSVMLELPNSFTMLDSDVMLLYFLWDIQDGTEIWRSLPQTLYFQDGMLEYNFDFTKFDANVFLDGTVDLDGLGADLTDNWIARVVVVPGLFSGRTSIDYSDYNQVKELYNLSPSRLATKDYPSRPE
ncbi:MAG: hypothetical protein RIM99_18650 [Cyclobacteriaceae bacterium]